MQSSRKQVRKFQNRFIPFPSHPRSLVLFFCRLTLNTNPIGPDVKYALPDIPIQPTKPRALNIAVMGPANAGKSTWTNRMCGARVTPVSSKPQTTRERMCGVATIDNTQLVIFDTPGLLSDMDRKSYVLFCLSGAN